MRLQKTPHLETSIRLGVFAKLIKTVELPGVESGNITIVVQALGRCRLEQITSTSPYYKGQVTSLPEKWPNLEDVHFQTLLDTLHQETTNFIHACDDMPNEAEYALNNISNPMIAANFICSNMPFSIEDKMEMLEKDNLSDRLYIALKAEHKELQLLSIQSDIKQKTRFDLRRTAERILPAAATQEHTRGTGGRREES